MQSAQHLAWVWIPIVIWAAFAQTVRNATQRTLTEQVGTLPATLVRFLYGLPCALLWLAVLWHHSDASAVMPTLHRVYLPWLALGALAQLGATALLLQAMKERNFIVAVTWSKTEILQVAAFSVLFLHERPTALSTLAMVIATVGVILLSKPAKPAKAVAPSSSDSADSAPLSTSWLNAATAYGLASGALFALSAVGYRGAALSLPGVSPWLAGAWGVVWAQVLQSAVLGSYLVWRDVGGLKAIARAWRLSLMAGTMGALASAGWFTAMTMRPAADVRTLGLIEVLFSYVVSRRLFREKLSRAETWGLGLVVVCGGL